MNFKLHGHPQRQSYTDPSQFIKPSFQGHFSLGPDDNPVESSHIHVEPSFPIYAELGAGPVDVPFTLQAHHFRGSIRGFYGEYFQKVIWDKTGTTSMPAMVGDPEGDLLWTGVATIDITKASDPRFNAKAPGWAMARFGARAYFGDVPRDDYRADVCGWCPFYSIVNPSAPEIPSQPEGSRGILSSRVDYSSPISGNSIGTMVCELQDLMPVGPISAPWLLKMFSAYNYTGSAPTSGAFEQRRDVTFHTGGQGITEVLTQAGRQGVNTPILLNPAAMGNGPHKEAFIWRQTLSNVDPTKTESVWSLITFPVTVGDQVPPMPELCHDPLALNVGQPLPCAYPAPVDPFLGFSPVFKRDPATNRVKVYTVDGVLVGEIAFK